jgi:hypothetical protein
VGIRPWQHDEVRQTAAGGASIAERAATADRALLNGQARQTQTAVDEEPPNGGGEQGSDPVALGADSEADDALDVDVDVGEAR